MRVRPATPADLPACTALTVEAIADLRRRQGRERPPLSAEDELRLLRHAHQLAPQGLHVAEDAGGRVAAFAAAWPRDGLWWLGHLFARPEAQGRGLGRALLERALAPGEGAANVLTFASSDPRAQTLYLRQGLLPRETVLSLVVEGAADAPASAPGSHALAPLRRSSLAFERERFGLARGHDHRFFLESGARGFEVTRAEGARAGFLYVQPDGVVGPLAAEAPDDVGPALALAAREAGGALTLRAPLANEAALAWCAERGARLTGTNLLMARAPLPRLDRVLLGPPGLA